MKAVVNYANLSDADLLAKLIGVQESRLLLKSTGQAKSSQTRLATKTQPTQKSTPVTQPEPIKP